MDHYSEEFDRVDRPLKATRKSVANNLDEIEFTDEKPFYEQRRKQLAPVTYVEEIPLKKNSKKSKFKNYLYKAGWWFCVFLALRLVFTKRGVLDYFAMEGILEGKKQELAELKKETKQLEKEIYKIQANKAHQKSLAREHLGVISEDEHLILFAQEKLVPSN